jgi:L-aspartate oxidase
VAALWEQVRIAPHITVRCGWRAITLATDDAGSVVGVHALDRDGNAVVLRASETVLATGGAGRLFLYTTNGPWAAGDGIAMAIAVGARTAALEFVQFHPTALRVDADPLPLLTEALRGAGAKLVTSRGDSVMSGRHPLGDLAPRDVVARAVWDASQSNAEVLLDATRVFSSPAGLKFPGALANARAYGLDPSTDPLPVTAAAHYYMGGVVVDDVGRTTVDGLWACGEVAYTGLHGANRLASNSLLEAVVCGRDVGDALSRRTPVERGTERAVEIDSGSDVEAAPEWRHLRQRLWQSMGPVRDGAALAAALAVTRATLATLPPGQRVLRQRHELALAMLQAAAAREESRGAHFRRDFPTRDQTRDGPDAVYPRAVA